MTGAGDSQRLHSPVLVGASEQLRPAQPASLARDTRRRGIQAEALVEMGEAATGCGSMDVHFVFSRAICCLFLVSGLAFDIPAPGPGAHHQSHGTGGGDGAAVTPIFLLCHRPWMSPRPWRRRREGWSETGKKSQSPCPHLRGLCR